MSGQRISESQDPRIRRTRQLLQRSLCSLLEKNDFDKISVQDIAAEATLNRATFYDHYTDKFALLECMVGSRFHELLNERQIQFEGGCAPALKALVLAVCDYLTGMRRIEPHMESAIIAVIRQILEGGLARHPLSGNVSPQLAVAAASWAIYGAAKEWMLTPQHCPSEDSAGAIAALVAPLLQLER